MKIRIPKTLFKYRNFDVNSIDVLLMEKILRANLLKLNYPFVVASFA